MKVFLIVIALWRADQTTPSMVQSMPTMESCEAVAKAIIEMSPQNKVKCVVTP